MKSKICSFFGHRDIKPNQKAYYNKEEGELQQTLEQTIVDLIENHSINEFYSSGLGTFDNMCASIVFKLQQNDKYSHIKSTRILHKMPKTNTVTPNHNVNYHETMLCDNAENVFAQGQIQNCNRYMVRVSDIVLVAIERSAISNSYKIYKYAKNQKKIVINLLDFDD